MENRQALPLIDTHCHLDFSDFDVDHQQVIVAAQQAQVQKIVIPSANPTHWSTILQWQKHPFVMAIAIGIHPWFVEKTQTKYLQLLSDFIANHIQQIQAIGECGLDFSISGPPQKQYDFFIQQIQLAKYYGLPLIIHHRQSHNEIIRLLKHYHFNQRGVIHAFSGSLQQAQQYIDLGFYLGVGGTITYPRAKKTRQALAQVPLIHLLLETDAPGMPTYGYQGQRNEPKYLPLIFKALCHLRPEPDLLISQQLMQNSQQLFCPSY